MKNLITLAFMAGLATMAACSSDDSTGGTGGAAGSSSGGGGTGGGTGGSASGGMAGMGAMGGMAGMGTGGGTTDGGMDCQTCTETNCKSDLDSCQANADCKKLVDCANACTDDACVQKCIADNSAGVAAFTPLATCIQTKCATECL